MGKGKQQVCVALVAVSTTLGITANSIAADLQPVSFNPADWLKPNAAFTIKLSESEANPASRLAFFIGTRDVSSLMNQTAPDEYRYSAGVLPLPSGEHRLVVYRVSSDNQWQTLGELALNVLTSTGFESAEITPRLGVTENSQFSSRARGDAFASDPEEFHHMAMSGGVATRHTRNEWELRSNWNVVGTSVKEQALRFGELEKDAPKTDLSDYLVEVQNGNNLLAVGHVNFGNNPLLVSGLANRGVLASVQAFNRLDVALTTQSGQSITGYNNLLGTRNYSNNSIQAGSLGFDFLPNSSASLRAEVTYLTAETTSDLGFNSGEVTDSEKSHGFGIVLTGQSANGRWRGDVSFAKSTFENPFDPFLFQGDELLETEATTDHAQAASFEFDIVQPNFETGSNNSLTLAVRHEQTDPLYKSVAAFLAPDTVNNSLELRGQLGQVSWQLQGAENRDNLDDLDTVLTTVTKSTAFSVNLPLQSMQATPRTWLPNAIGYNAQRVRQFGDNLPVDFDPFSQIPDQVNLLHAINLAWQLGSVGLNYSFNWSDQDNRQGDREDADFRDTNHGLAINFPLFQRINMSLALGSVRAADKEQSLARYTDSFNISMDWRCTDNLSLSTNYSYTEGDDSKDFTISESQSSQAQLSYQFTIPTFGGTKLPGQLFLRYSMNDNFTEDRQFQFESDGKSWATHSGFSLNFF